MSESVGWNTHELQNIVAKLNYNKWRKKVSKSVGGGDFIHTVDSESLPERPHKTVLVTQKWQFTFIFSLYSVNNCKTKQKF